MLMYCRSCKKLAVVGGYIHFTDLNITLKDSTYLPLKCPNLFDIYPIFTSLIRVKTNII